MARSCNGTTQGLQTAATALTNGYSALTISLWANLAALQNFAIFLTNYDGSNGWYLQEGGPVGNKQNSAWLVAGVITGGTDNYLPFNLNFAANFWHHIVAVYDGSQSGSNRLKVYLEGALFSPGTGSGTIPSTLPNTTGYGIQMGFLQQAGNSYLNGSLAEIALWNAVLSAAEIAGMQNERTEKVRPGSLVAYWPLWGLSSPELDLSGAARNMSLTSSPSAANHAPIPLYTRKARTFFEVPGIVPKRPLVYLPPLSSAFLE
jgi:hypothetical protein